MKRRSESRVNEFRWTADQIPAEKTLELESNQPLIVPPDHKAVGRTTQTQSFLQLENLSVDNTLRYFVEGGQALTRAGEIPANDSTPKHWVKNFNGAQLVVANVSTRAANMKVTLISP